MRDDRKGNKPFGRSDDKKGGGRYGNPAQGFGGGNFGGRSSGGRPGEANASGRGSGGRPGEAGAAGRGFGNRPGEAGAAGRSFSSRTGGPGQGGRGRGGSFGRPGAGSDRPGQRSRQSLQTRTAKPEKAVKRIIDYSDEPAEQDYIENRIEGKNPVMEALKSDRTIEKLLIAKGNTEGSIREIIKRARDKKIIIQEVDRQRLDEISRSGAHQGVIAYVTPYEYVEVEDIIARAKEKGEAPFIVILDEITDPHNLGAVIRTAECCGAHGVIIPKRRSVGLSPAAIKSSAGAVEYVPVAKVTNIATLLDELKEQGIWIAGADVDGQNYTEQDLKGPLAIVIGSEGEGISRLVKEKCDFLVRIPLKGRIESLNASVAAGILMYEAVRQRG